MADDLVPDARRSPLGPAAAALRAAGGRIAAAARPGRAAGRRARAGGAPGRVALDDPRRAGRPRDAAAWCGASRGRAGGIFVAERKVERDLTSLAGLPAYLRRQGFQSDARVLSTATIERRRGDGRGAGAARGRARAGGRARAAGRRRADLARARAAFRPSASPACSTARSPGRCTSCSRRDYGARARRGRGAHRGGRRDRRAEARLLGCAAARRCSSIARTAWDAGRAAVRALARPVPGRPRADRRARARARRRRRWAARWRWWPTSPCRACRARRPAIAIRSRRHRCGRALGRRSAGSAGSGSWLDGIPGGTGVWLQAPDGVWLQPDPARPGADVPGHGRHAVQPGGVRLKPDPDRPAATRAGSGFSLDPLPPYTPPAHGRARHHRDAPTHRRWDETVEPVVSVQPGDVIAVETDDFAGGQISRDSTSQDLLSLDFDQIYPLEADPRGRCPAWRRAGRGVPRVRGCRIGGGR